MAMSIQALGGHGRGSRRKPLALLFLSLLARPVCHAFVPTASKTPRHVPLSSWSGASSYLDTIQKAEEDGSAAVAENTFYATNGYTAIQEQPHPELVTPMAAAAQQAPYYYDTPAEAPIQGSLLPDGWTAHLDPQSGRFYYFYAADGTSTWELPAMPEPALQALRVPLLTTNGPTTTVQQPVQPTMIGPADEPQLDPTMSHLPDGWTAHIDPESGCYYFYFEADGTSTWERPAMLAPGSQASRVPGLTNRVERTMVVQDTTQQPSLVEPMSGSPIPKTLGGLLDLKQALPVTQDKNMNMEKDMTLTQQEAEDLKAIEARYLKMMSSEIGVKQLNGQNPYSVLDIRYDVLLSQWLDTVEDALMKMRRKMAEDSDYDMDKKGNRPTVVVLGTGWAAQSFVKIASTFDLNIIVVSPVNHFVFTPMLASAAVGTIEYRSMTEPIRASNPTIDSFVEGRAVGVDVEKRELTVELTAKRKVDEAIIPMVGSPSMTSLEDVGATGEGPQSTIYYETDTNNEFIQLKYDHLICAVGTNVRSSIVPGAQQHCYNLKTSEDSKKLRTAIGEALEFASRPDIRGADYALTQERQRRVRFVIIGGGPTGVELAGELNDFLKEICEPKTGAYQRLADDYQVILVHGGPDLLPQFNPQLRQCAVEALERRGVEVRLNTRISKVSSNFVKLQKKGGDVIEVIPNGLTVWAAGNEPVPFVKELLSKLPEDARGSAGRINVDPWLRCPTPTPESFGSVLVLGDAACLEVDSKYEAAASLPQTAQVAGQQGCFAARLLNRGYDLTQTPPRLPETKPYDKFSPLRVWLLVRGLDNAPDFAFLNLGLLAYVGGGEALTQVQVGDVPIFDFAGKTAFALWRSVYLAKQVDSRNQAMISFDWLKSNVYGRDITRL